jgi:hypothetical protein
MGGLFPSIYIYYSQEIILALRLSLFLNEWFGFVDVSQLQKGVKEGSDYVKARVLATQNEKLVLGIRGQSPTSPPLETSSSVIAAFSPVTA